MLAGQRRLLASRMPKAQSDSTYHLKALLRLQNVGEQRFVLSGPFAVQAVVALISDAAPSSTPRLKCGK
jgi:hypothetical protein